MTTSTLTCPRCKVNKATSEFSKDKTQSRGYRSYCKKCHCAEVKQYRIENLELCRRKNREYRARNRDRINAQQRDYYKQDPTRGRRNNLFNHYGITLEQYETMLESQNGLCACCGRPPCLAGWSRKRLGVDHCHKTNKIRGLLCGRCNLAIGYLRDDPEMATALANYLTKYLNENQRPVVQWP